jgi:6-pyruvoyl-tetrahydropterin synthase
MISLVFDELTFSAAHYIVGHEKCGCIHGHTFFIKHLTFEFPDESLSNIPDIKLNKQGILIDFAKIKDYIKTWDHKFIVPVIHHEFWDGVFESPLAPVFPNLLYVQHTSCEGMAMDIKFDLEELAEKETGVKAMVHFTLYEGPNQGVSV